MRDLAYDLYDYVTQSPLFFFWLALIVGVAVVAWVLIGQLIEAIADLLAKTWQGATREKGHRGRVTSVAGIHEKLLTSDERERLNHLRSERTRHRDFWMGYGAVALWAVASVLLVVLVERVDTKAGSPKETFTSVLMAAVLLVGWIPAVLVGNRQAKASRQRRIEDFLDGIEFQDRGPRVPSHGRSDRSEEGPHYWATGNYEPERYYRETGGWSKEYRDYVKDAYGDLDTYESNKPD